MTKTLVESVKPLRLDAYYYGFDGSGVDEIDLILSAVACAGKAYHHTDDWTDATPLYDERFKGANPVEWIQNAATEAAAEITRLASRIEELERAQADLAADLERRARTCERLNPKAHDGPSYHRLDGKAQAYRHAAELARQTHSDKG
jgi:hypothetical protein